MICPIRCYASCQTSYYNIKQVQQYCTSQLIKTIQFSEVIYFSQTNIDHHTVDVFIFYFGSVVIWGADIKAEKIILDMVAPFANKTTSTPSVEIIQCKYDPNYPKHGVNNEKDYIILNNDDVFTKFSVSYALAQSVKLSFLEQSIEKLIKNTASVQLELSQKGNISLSKKEISKKMGELFSERYSINLHNDILDTPEFFWKKPVYEPLYIMTAEFQDVQIRQNILNRKLDMIHDLYQILSNDLTHKNSTRLEIIIIILITIEVLLGIVHLIIK